jgi:transcriptional regulator with XRE-family HTH domain
MSTLSARLIELRKEKGLTQKNLADFLGIAPVSWQRFEYGSSKPKLENIITLADYFNVSIDYLVGRTNNPEINR